MSPSLAALEPVLRCPVTGKGLRAGPSSLITEDGLAYPVIDGIPRLIAADNPLFGGPAGASTASPRRIPPLLARAARIGPGASISIGAAARCERLAELVRGRTAGDHRPARVLVIGGGIAGRGMETLLRDPRIELVETDVYVGPRTQIVCDAHQLPFAEGTFDGAVAQAVLEHVVDPVRVVDELRRVLRPGGYVYAETPFMQQVHEGAFDFTRFTHVGHRRLFRWFDEIDSGAASGPATGFVWALRYLGMSVAGRRRVVRRVLDRAITLLAFWVKYLDYWLARTPGGLDAASAVYFLGRLRESPVGDGEVVAGYRGAMRARVNRC